MAYDEAVAKRQGWIIGYNSALDKQEIQAVDPHWTDKDAQEWVRFISQNGNLNAIAALQQIASNGLGDD